MSCLLDVEYYKGSGQMDQIYAQILTSLVAQGKPDQDLKGVLVSLRELISAELEESK